MLIKDTGTVLNCSWQGGGLHSMLCILFGTSDHFLSFNTNTTKQNWNLMKKQGSRNQDCQINRSVFNSHITPTLKILFSVPHLSLNTQVFVGHCGHTCEQDLNDNSAGLLNINHVLLSGSRSSASSQSNGWVRFHP